MTRNELQPYLTVRVDPAEMVQYVHMMMSVPRSEPGGGSSSALAERQWGGDTRVARAAQLRWSALNRAFGDARVRLTLAEDEVVFDIPTLLDATLQLCEPVGNA